MENQEQLAESDEAGGSEPAGIRLRGLHDLEPMYANYLSVSFDVFSFHIAFSRVIGPIFEDATEREVFAREGWSADVVSRLLVPPEALRQMVNYLQAQLGQYDAAQAGESADGGLLVQEQEA